MRSGSWSLWAYRISASAGDETVESFSQIVAINLSGSAVMVVAVVVLGYFMAILLFGTYFSRFSRTINDYFFSGQRFAWWLAAASMVATGIGSYSYLKYSEQGYNTGMSSTMTYTNDWFIVPFFMFGWLPVIYFNRIRSIPEYFERRFNRTARYIAVVILLAYMFFYIGYNLFTIGVALQGMFGIPQLYSVPLVALFLGVYVSFGGQTAVIFTDLVQGIMLYLAGAIAIIAGVVALGGLDQWWAYLPVAHRLPFVHLTADPKFNTVGLFWGEALAGSIAFSFMNQGFIMRYLALKSVHEGRKACLFNVVVTLPLSAVVVGAVGWIARSLVVKQACAGGVLPGLQPVHIENSFHTFIVVCWEVLRHNPWLFGFVIAALTAALMSTIDTLINACAAIGIYDIYRPLIRPRASERHYLRAARVASAVATVVGVLLVIWFNRQKGTLMSMHYRGIMIIIPSIVTALFLGVFWKDFTARGACTAMITGSGITILSLFYPELIRPLAAFVGGAQNQSFIYMRALLGMVVTAAVGVAVSLAERRGSAKDVAGLTVGTLQQAMRSYKGGDPNHHVGRIARKLRVEIDESLPAGTVAVSASVMDRVAGDPGDIVYVCDARWYLGGLRSDHLRLLEPHQQGEDTALMSSQTIRDAFLLADRPVSLEKII